MIINLKKFHDPRHIIILKRFHINQIQRISGDIWENCNNTKIMFIKKGRNTVSNEILINFPYNFVNLWKHIHLVEKYYPYIPWNEYYTIGILFWLHYVFFYPCRWFVKFQNIMTTSLDGSIACWVGIGREFQKQASSFLLYNIILSLTYTIVLYWYSYLY